MNEETKKILEKSIPMIIYVILMFAILYQYNKISNIKRDLEISENARKTEAATNAINKPSEEVTNREENLYPVISKKIDELNNTIKKLNSTIKELETNKPTREQSNAIFKNQSSSEISRFLNSINIPVTVKSCTSN